MKTLEQERETTTVQTTLTEDELRIMAARHHDPFAVLGRHPDADGTVAVSAFIPYATEVSIAEGSLSMRRVGDTDFFRWRGPASAVPPRYRFIWRDDARH